VFELWFKLILVELRLGRDKLATAVVQEETIPYVVHHLRRISEILRVAASHWKVVETLAPQDFLEFRSKLGTASGFQSFQLRELETVLGLEPSQRKKHGHPDPLDMLLETLENDNSNQGKKIKSRLESVRTELSFRKALHNWLYRTPIHGSYPDDPNDLKNVDNFLSEYTGIQRKSAEKHIQILLAHQGSDKETEIRNRFEPGIKASENFLCATDISDTDERARIKRIRTAVLFIESYRTLPLLAWPRLLLDTVAELEEQLILFRTHQRAWSNA